MQINGKCLCGSVELEIELANPDLDIAACHCSRCRNWLGGPMLAFDSGVLISISDESCVTRYDSSEWAERAFCNKCGTSLFYYLKPADQYHFSIGLFDNDVPVKLSHQIFIEEKPEYYSFSNQTENMTGAEVFAHFEGAQEDSQ